MFSYKRNERCNKFVRIWLAIYAIEYFGERDIAFLEKRIFQILRHFPFEHLFNKTLSKRCAAPFVAKYETERRDVGCNLLAVVESRVGSGA